MNPSLLKRLIMQVSTLHKVISLQQPQHELKPEVDMYLMKSSPNQLASEHVKKSPCQISSQILTLALRQKIQAKDTLQSVWGRSAL